MTVQEDIKRLKVYRNRKQGDEKELFERVIGYLDRLSAAEEEKPEMWVEADGDE